MRVLAISLLLIVASCAKDRGEVIEDEQDTGVALSSSDTDKTLFVWDFSEPKSYIYTMQTEINTSVTMEEGSPMNDMDMEQVMEATYRIRAKENGRADIYVQDFKVLQAPFPGMEDMIESQLPQEPTIIIQDMTAGGDYDTSDSFNLAGIEGMGAIAPLILPTRDLSIGETDTISMNYAMDQDIMDFDFKQSIYLTFAGYDEYEGKNCAVLVAEFSLDESNMAINDPEMGEGSLEMDVDLNSGSRYYWDPVGHYFVGAEVLMDGTTGLAGTGALADLPEGMNVDIDVVQRIKLEAIEE
ncbi:MAG: hypothetical protein AAFY91_00810 [Bacteroidota bacterium]